jgi:hypothetical protein
VLRPFEPEVTPEARRLAPGEDLVILSSETRSTRHPKAVGPTASRQAQGQGQGRTTKQSRRPRQADRARPTTLAQEDAAARLAPRLGTSPLVGPLVMVGGLSGDPTYPDQPGSATTLPEPGLPPRTVPVVALAMKEAVGSPQRLREALVLNELLQPPLALRRRGFPRLP